MWIITRKIHIVLFHQRWARLHQWSIIIIEQLVWYARMHLQAHPKHRWHHRAFMPIHILWWLLTLKAKWNFSSIDWFAKNNRRAKKTVDDWKKNAKIQNTQIKLVIDCIFQRSVKVYIFYEYSTIILKFSRLIFVQDFRLITFRYLSVRSLFYFTWMCQSIEPLLVLSSNQCQLMKENESNFCSSHTCRQQKACKLL